MTYTGFPFRSTLLRSAVAGAVLAAAGLILRALLSTSVAPELLADQFTLLLPPRAVAYLLGSVEKWGRPFLFVGLLGVWLLLGLALGVVRGYLAWRRPKSLAPIQDGPSRPGQDVWLSFALGLVPWFLGALVIAPLSDGGLLGSEAQGGAARFSGALFISCLVFGLSLHSLVAAPLMGTPQPSAADTTGARMGRRQFLTRAAFGAVSLAGAVLLYRNFTGILSSAGSQAPERARGELVSEVTPNDEFYVVSKNFADPRVDVSRWRLQVTGLVERPLTFSYDEFTALPSVEEYVTLECISNEVGGDLISNALWRGVPLKEVLNRAGVKPQAREVVSFASDGYTESLPVESAMRDEVLVAYQMNGEPLPDEHGFPARLLIPDRYGMKSTKWVEGFDLVAEEFFGYWEQRGWDKEAFVKPTSRLDVPQIGRRLPLGLLTVGGIAFSGSRGISKVEVSMDQGETWHEATVRRTLSPHTLGAMDPGLGAQPSRGAPAHGQGHEWYGRSPDRGGDEAFPQRLHRLSLDLRRADIGLAFAPAACRRVTGPSS